MTRAPARYTEASLVKELEDREIGRPSTYASIIGTILDRGYVFKKGTALVPSFLAFAVVTLLERHFGRLVDYDFTARMEDGLDEIARGEAARVPWLRRFYFGTDGEEGLKELVSDLEEIDAREVSSFPLAGTDIVVRVGRYGPYLERDGQRVNVPGDIAPDELTPEKADALLDQPSGDVVLGTDPESGHQIVAKSGRFGPYVTEVLPEDATGEAAHLLAAEVDVAGHGDAGGRAAPAHAAAHARRDRRRAGHGAERPVRPVREEGHGQPVAGERGAAVHPHARRGQGGVRAAQGPRRPGRRAAAAGTRRGPGIEPCHRDQGGQVRSVRDRRRDECVAAPGDEVESITIQRAVELLAERRAAGPAAPRRSSGTARRSPAKPAGTRRSGARPGAARRPLRPADAARGPAHASGLTVQPVHMTPRRCRPRPPAAARNRAAGPR